jgi:DNA-binding NarL/FixJ family response regulator
MTSTPTKILLAAPFLLDRLAVSALLCTRQGLSIVSCESSLADALTHCRLSSVDLAILDVGFPGKSAFQAGHSLVGERLAKCVLFLDRELALARVQQSLEVPRSFYMTRDLDICTIVETCISRVLANTTLPERDPTSRVFHRSPGLHMRVDAHSRLTIFTGRSFPKHPLRAMDEYGILQLTRREREVFEYLVQGYSGREIGDLMELAPSTVDNHKVNLMKKLGLRRRTELIHVAIQTGLFAMLQDEHDVLGRLKQTLPRTN